MSFEKEVEKISQLARLDLNKEEKEKLAKELSSILEYFTSIQEADVEGVDPSPYPLDLKNVFREDKVEESFEKQKVKDAFPEKEKGYLKIKSVQEEWKL
jgi:aspartyl-tRNA(Asn)/glutamyl-tRNA(Gln) amidotransferase subunit C